MRSDSGVVAGTWPAVRPAVDDRLAVDERPEIGVQAAMRFGDHAQRRRRVVAHRPDLLPVANDARVVSSFSNAASRMRGHAGDVEAVECRAVGVASRQDGAPGQAGLRAFQRQQLEQRACRRDAARPTRCRDSRCMAASAPSAQCNSEGRHGANPPPPLAGGGWGEGFVQRPIPLPPAPSRKGRGIGMTLLVHLTGFTSTRCRSSPTVGT